LSYAPAMKKPLRLSPEGLGNSDLGSEHAAAPQATRGDAANNH